MPWDQQLRGDSVSWLAERENPGVRYLALTEILGLTEADSEVQAARQLAYAQGPIATVLGAMDERGFWVKPGSGYAPKYRGTVWSVITLAQLGARAALDERIESACRYLMDHALTERGQFSVTGAPSGTIECLQGNLCAAMLDLGYDDPRLEGAFEWMARTVTGEGVAPMEDKQAEVRYYAGNCGPRFACGANNKLPCAWGGVKVMLALGKLPLEKRTSLVQGAIREGIDFLLGVDPAQALYPTGWSDKPSRNWWKFGFPVFYVTDLLQVVEALVGLGYGSDPRAADAWEIIRGKQDCNGRWALEYDYAGKTWVDWGEKKQPNKWVTLRAARVLRQAYLGGMLAPSR